MVYCDSIDFFFDYNEEEKEGLEVYQVSKVRDGRFVGSTLYSHKLQMPKDDTSCIVTYDVSNDHCDDAAIPKFLEHVSSNMWMREYRNVLKCQDRIASWQSLIELH